MSQVGEVTIDQHLKLAKPTLAQEKHNRTSKQRAPAPGKAAKSKFTRKVPPPIISKRMLAPSPIGAAAVQAGAPAPSPVKTERAANKTAFVRPLDPSPAAKVADKYVIEREQKRCNGFDIPKHARYTFIQEMSAEYAGTRRIDEQVLALLKVGKEILVLPVDEATARRLKRISLGQQIEVSAKGVIKMKGRSR